MSEPIQTVIDGPRYVVVIDHLRGLIYRVPKRREPRVGLMRFGRACSGGERAPDGAFSESDSEQGTR